MQSTGCSPDVDFEGFLEKLRCGTPLAWRELIGRFRKRLICRLSSQVNRYPQDALLTKRQFVEEVFEESLIKFYELFQNGKFESYGDLEATIVTVAGYKLKEGFARLRRERKLYAGDATEHIAAAGQRSDPSPAGVDEDLLLVVRDNIVKLDNDERELLVSYYNGEELQDIARSQNISPEACRKRKQRALEKLKNLVLTSLKTNLCFLWPIMMSALKT